MSTDDSVSEDVSSSVGALSHGRASVDGEGEGGKESEEASLVSSEGTGTSASGRDARSHAASQDRHTHSDTQTTAGTVESRHLDDLSPACNKIRSLCLGPEEAFGGRSLPFINPSSLETLRALVQEIHSSGETDPEIWKDCEGRWLHLFQLVEKQYQEQIVAQQEQYQCQIQLIQDEIKALVQIQNRPPSLQPITELSPTSVTKAIDRDTHTKDFNVFPLHTAPKNPPVDNANNDTQQAPLISTHPALLLTSQSVPCSHGDEEGTHTIQSSGYGTLSAWDTHLEEEETSGRPGGGGDGVGEREKENQEHHWEDTEMTVIGRQQASTNQRSREEEQSILEHQQGHTGSSQSLTSWAQRQRLRPKKSKAASGPSGAPPPAQETQEQPPNPAEPHTQNQPPQRHTALDLREPHRLLPLENPDYHEQQRASLSAGSFPLRRSDSLMSEASGLTYWRLNESELYHPLPDSFDSGAYLLLQDASDSYEPRLSLKEIYQNKQRTDCKRSDWERSVTSSPLSPQMLTLDPAAQHPQWDRTSGFTSPSRFSSPSFNAQPAPPQQQQQQQPFFPRTDTPEDTPPRTPDDSNNPGDTDYVSDASSVSNPGRFGHKVGQKTQWENNNNNGSQDSRNQQCTTTSSHTLNQQQQCRDSVPLASEEDGSHTHTSTLKPCAPAAADPGSGPRSGESERENTSLEDPVVLSLLRQNLREKHSRHVADLRAYYEAEIQVLRDRLQLAHLPRDLDLDRSNHALTKRCKYLEKALAEATSRIQELETTNSSLEKRLAEWPERYAVAVATLKSVQQRSEEGRRAGREREALVARLKAHVKQLEETLHKTRGEAEEKEARRLREHNMLQDLLREYDSLVKEHDGVKNNTVATEDKLVDANDQISELKRMVSKLESQVKQLEHENKARARHPSHSHTLPSGAGLYHHPDLLLSPGKGQTGLDVPRRRSRGPSEQMKAGRKSLFTQNNQARAHKETQYPSSDQASETGSSGDTSGGSWRCASPPECEQSLPQPSRRPEVNPRHPEQTLKHPPEQPLKHPEVPGRKEGPCAAMTPMMRALIELEETRATQSRAPWVGNQKTTVGLVERRHKELIQDRVVGPHEDRDPLKPSRAGLHDDRDTAKPCRGKQSKGGNGAAALLRAQRSLSPEGLRSSSLPPERHAPPNTPPRRETLLMPRSAKSSPKRCPTENYSTAFALSMPREEHMRPRFEGEVDPRRHSFHSGSPRKRLQFPSADNDFPPADSIDPETLCPLSRDPQRDREVDCVSPPLLTDRIHSLAEAERLLDELTQEKLHIEAALSRMPGSGGRVSLQTRLDEVSLEKRLDRLNRELGSIRMTLKRFHVLRSSANI